jgi:hypothetical protein
VQLLHNRILVPIITGEPLIKCLGITKYIRKQEVKERPKLVQVVLQGGTSNEKAISGVEKANDLRQGRFLVLDSMRLNIMLDVFLYVLNYCFASYVLRWVL